MLPLSSPFRLALGLVLAAVAGCHPAPVAGEATHQAADPSPVNKAETPAPLAASPLAIATLPPVVSLTKPSNPSATTAPTATTTPVPLAAEPDFVAPEPEGTLAPATTDSDLDADEERQAEQALRDSDTAAYFPPELIHDGGVAIYRLSQAQGPKAASSKPDDGLGGLLDLPSTWTRTATARGGVQLVLRRDCMPGDDCQPGRRRIRAKVVYQQKGRVNYTNARNQATTKTFGELAQRILVLRPNEGRLRVTEVSPLLIETNGGRTGLEIEQLRLFGRLAQPLLTVSGEKAPTLLTDGAPRLAPGIQGRVEVDIRDRRPGGVWVFVSQVAEPMAARLRALDDGVAPDLTAGDGRYAVTVTVPTTPGLHHLVVEAVDPASFVPNRPFRANSVAISYVVDAGL